MPAPNLNNPICIPCNRSMRKNGFQTSGAQQYRCSGCGATQTEGGRPEGRIPLGIDRVKDPTRAATDRKYRVKQKLRNLLREYQNRVQLPKP